MPDGAGEKHPNPQKNDRKPHGLNGQAGKSGINEPSGLERLLAASQLEKRAQRKRDSRVLAVLLVVIVVVAGGGVFALVRFAPASWRHLASTRPAPSPARPTPSSTLPTVLSSAGSLLRPVTANGPPADPFAGSPSDHWADGAAGIVIPAARAHGPYTAAQVKAAYETTRKLLIAANLNWPTLRGGPPTALADLLIKQERTQFLAGLRTTALAKDGTEENTRTEVTSFAPGSTTFVTTVVKVHGTMSAGTATDSGTEVLRITFDYLFVFAVEPPGQPANWERVVEQHYGSVVFTQWDDPGGPLEPWFSSGFFAAGAKCGERDGYIHPDYPQSASSGPTPSGAPKDPYALATSGPNGCQAITGT
jgi:hypothetical protein